MSRKEEILGYCGECNYKPFSTEACTAIKAIEWADQNPRKGLWDGEKVIDYIYHHARVRTFGDIVIDDMSVTEFIETMKKAMEE